MKTNFRLIVVLGAALFAGMCMAKAGELHDAAKKGDLVRVKALVGKDKVNGKDDKGCTPLMWASKTNVVEFLLANGADVNAKNDEGSTSLHIAAMNGYKEVVEQLLAKGADVNAKAPDGCTPLHLAALAGRKRVDRTATRNKDGTWTTMGMVLQESCKDVVAVLVENGANVNAKESRTGMTPLHVASLKGYKDVVEYLISKGADVNAKDNDGDTALAVSVRDEVSKILKKHGAKR